MSLLLLFGGAAPPPPILLDPWATSFWMWSADGSIIEPVPYIDVSGRLGRYKNGGLSLTVPSSSAIVSLFQGATVGQEFAQTSVRMYHRSATPLLTAIMGGATMKSTGDAGTAEIFFDEAFIHFARRRVLSKTAQASASFSGVAADTVALGIMMAEMGPTVVTPATYPPGESRTDFGQFTVTVAAAHSPALSASLPDMEEQSGTNVAGLMEEFFEQEDLAVLCEDNLDQTFDIDVDHPFELTDRSASVVFGEWYGNMTGFEAVNNIKALANVWGIEGANVGSHNYVSEPGSIAAWGVFEAHGQKPQVAANSADAAQAAAYLMTRFANGVVTYRADIIERDGCLFNVDFFWRDRVRFESAVWGYTFEEVLQEVEFKGSDGGPLAWQYTFGVPPVSSLSDTESFVGRRGAGAGEGNRWRNKRQ